MPLLQSKQLYSSMDLSIRKELPGMLSKMATDHQLDALIMPSFTLVHGYRTKVQAADYVYAMLALLETPMQDKKPSDCFLDAAYCLSRQNKNLLSEGIQSAKKFLSSLFKTVQSILDMKQVNNAGPFLYMFVQEGTVDYKYYSKPHALSLLAMFTLKAYVASSIGSRTRNLSKPLVASAPLDALAETCLMIGIPPVSEVIPRSFFGKAFEQAADKTGSRVRFDYFDSSIVSIHKADRHKFIDALYYLLM
uniref:Cell division control protein 45 homolog n=1 Tax=Cacopsylla melanoneura TaxID=428564 RepID=A0A8D8SNC8_9HEMI